MNEDEINQIYFGLMGFLRQNDFEELANDIAAQVEEGYVKKEKVKVDLTLLEDTDKVGRSNTTSTRQLYRRAEFTPKERLEILLNAIETAIINPVKIKAEVANFFAQRAKRSSSVKSSELKLFTSVDENVEPLTLDQQETRRELNRLEGLMSALDAIKRELGNGNSQ